MKSHATALFALALSLLVCLVSAEGREAPPERAGDPYPLATCPVTGRPVADAKTVLPDGREVRFCCPACIETFNNSSKTYLDKLDGAIIEDQLKVYPRKATCVVMDDEELSDPLGPDAADSKPLVVGNRLFRICCKKCIAKIKGNPAKYLAALDAQVIADQKPSYPLTTCIVSDEPLDEKAVDVVVANRLMRVCCSKCTDKILANPAAYIKKIDDARASAPSSKSASK